MKRVHILVSGDVTGVGFRLSTIYIARDLGLVGWVRNIEGAGLPANNRSTSRAPLSGGKASGKIWRVEIIAEGPKEKLENLVTWARKGPPVARVDRVKVDWQDSPPAGEEKFSGFEVKR